MARSDKEIQRMINLLAFLNRRQGQKVERVAEELGLSPRQLLKELERISLFGAPPFGPSDLFMATVDEDGCLDIAYAEQFRAPLHLTLEEALVLRTALMRMMEKASPALLEMAGKVLAKLEQALLPKDRLAIERLKRSMISQRSRQAEARWLDLLRQAREKRTTVEIYYFTASSEQLTRRRVDPYGFIHYAGNWYMVGHCHNSDERRIFKVERIRDLSLTDATYSIPQNFNISDYARPELFRLQGKERTVRIWFSPRIARWILERNPQAERQKDGSAVLEIKAQGFAWIARWVLQYGLEAKILEPPEAREEVLGILGKGRESQASL